MIKPPVLKTGDTVQVVASSSAFDQASFLSGVEILRSFGLKVKYRADIFDELPYLAGPDKRRFTELKQALTDKNVKAILFARGGYGAARLLPALQKLKLRVPPKIIAGFSDVTTLHLYFEKFYKWAGFYAPMIGGNMRQMHEAFTADSFCRTLMNPEPLGRLEFPETHIVRHGIAQGRLAGGCLSLVVTSLGTPYELNTDNTILFLEDVHEKPYQIDRMLMHLKMAGKFKKCRGVIFGVLNGPNPVEHYEEAIRDVFHDIKIPVIMGFPSGHIPKMMTLPLGVKTAMNTRTKTVTFLESPFAPNQSGTRT